MASTKLATLLKQQIAANNNRIETGKPRVSDIPKEFVQEVKQNAAAMPNDFFNQLLGIENTINKNTSKQTEVEMKPGQEFNLTTKKDSNKNKSERKDAVAPAIHYHEQIVRSSEQSNKNEIREIQLQIQQIMDELKRLVDSSHKIMQVKYAEISVQKTPATVGKYHLNFFSWMLSVISDTRRRVEDSGAWLAVMRSKKGKRDYWSMFKKHGTSFGMSNERVVATQTG
jgi:hypothetical protein